MNKLKSPNGIVADANGNVFVADEGKYCIRKIAPDGTASILAGSITGIAGHKDGKGTDAIFSNISGMVLDRFGNILAVDCGTGYIRKITPDGTVSTIAGNGVQTSGNGPLAIVNGPALSVSFTFPRGIGIDSKGNIYVTDNNSLIRKLDATGNVSTFAGGVNQGNRDGLGTAALFNAPQDIAIDAADNLFITDRQNHSIRKIDKTATYPRWPEPASQGLPMVVAM
ncbi:SBBP repeat-containing protein [Pedobacter sp. W3I1]|uniref:SBBP repeat-containing protein n=1 Tax=Pedobacter sp. W3I1 TaxID=3042291 RepID=UPI0027D8E341|nr:SBBP repeat-containing protein [Pedobacter sp. W3I1]